MIAHKVVPGEECIMKVRVQYTIEVSESDLRALEHNMAGERTRREARDDVRIFLMDEGVGGWVTLLQTYDEYRNRSED